MRNMSFLKTLGQMQFADPGPKDITSRDGWWFLKPGDVVMAVKKAMGLKRGEKVEKLYPIEIVSTRRYRLGDITQADVIREGFPNWTPEQFVDFFCHEMKCGVFQALNRIEFKRIKP